MNRALTLLFTFALSACANVQTVAANVGCPSHVTRFRPVNTSSLSGNMTLSYHPGTTLLVAVFAINQGSDPSVTACDWNGAPLTRAGRHNAVVGGGVQVMEVWYLQKPAIVTNDFHASFSQPINGNVEILAFSGCDNPYIRTVAFSSGNSGSPSVTVPSTIINGNVVAQLNTAAFPSSSNPGAGQTFLDFGITETTPPIFHHSTCQNTASGGTTATFAITPSMSWHMAGFEVQAGNVTWTASDSLAACPAGDTLIFQHSPLHPHPSRLRILLTYLNASCSPRVGVPPESIWVAQAASTGNLTINDKSTTTFADDSTNAAGKTRITIPSFSGCGTVTLRLFVSGVDQGTRTIVVRTTDTNADGRVTSTDQTGACDVNYNGTADDATIVSAHTDHWRRNALHGTLVRRTNYCENCEEYAVGSRGETELFWSPSGRFVSHTAFVDGGPGNPACKVFIVPSDPKDGNALTQFSFAPIYYHDYDPSWSPNNKEIAFGRADSVIIRKPVPWVGTTETAVTASSNCGPHRGDATPAISPDGRWVAFIRCNPNPPGGWSIWKVPITGGTATQLTPTAARADFYPTWSPDGLTIYFQRNDAAVSGLSWTLWKVPASGGTAQQVFIPPSSPDVYDAVQPATSSDGAILITGYGKRDDLVRNVVTHTLDPTIPSPTPAKLVANYPDTTFAEKGDFPLPSPRLSPDGTRLVLGSKQIWAARRNMNRPPAFTSVTSFEEGTRAVTDTASLVNFAFDPFSPNFITVLASDPEANALTYRASFLQSWMSWNPSTRTLTASNPIPPSARNKTFWVKFWVTTASGGTDAFIAEIFTGATFNRSAARSAAEELAIVLGPNPTNAEFAVMVPFQPQVVAKLSVFDVSGRLVGHVSGPTGAQLVWEGKDLKGGRAASGIYVWRLEAGTFRREGKLVVVR